MDIRSTATDPQNDPLAQGPPLPALQTVKSLKPATMPSVSQDNAERAARAAHVLGLSSAFNLMRNMMQLQKLVEEMGRTAPQIIQVFAPAIEQARDIAASSLANLAQGGPGASETGMGAPPPGGTGLGPNMAGPGQGVGEMAPMPMPIAP